MNNRLVERRRWDIERHRANPKLSIVLEVSRKIVTVRIAAQHQKRLRLTRILHCKSNAFKRTVSRAQRRCCCCHGGVDGKQRSAITQRAHEAKAVRAQILFDFFAVVRIQGRSFVEEHRADRRVAIFSSPHDQSKGLEEAPRQVVPAQINATQNAVMLDHVDERVHR